MRGWYALRGGWRAWPGLGAHFPLAAGGGRACMMGRGVHPRGAGLGAPCRGGGCPVRIPALSEVFRDALAAPLPHPAPPLTLTPCALQVAWDPEPESQEECPVTQVQVLET